jgi:hypothetical protein
MNILTKKLRVQKYPRIRQKIMKMKKEKIIKYLKKLMEAIGKYVDKKRVNKK